MFSDICVGQVRNLLSLHLKIPKSGIDLLLLAAAHVGDRLSDQLLRHYPVETQQPF